MSDLSQPSALREGPGGSEHGGSGAPGALQGTRPESAESAAESSAIRCAACGAVVTHPRESIEPSGSHAHTFLNPAGIVFRIRCFRAAPGALGVGETSDYWSWFAGFHWQACICRQCLEHLGWAFLRPGERFFGLIAERIVEEPGGERSGS